MQVILLCGYRRTGKDTLYQKLSRTDTTGFLWTIYQHPDRVSVPFPSESKYIRSAFADALKVEAGRIYDIPETIPDANKDIQQFIHYKTGALVSARDIYIEWGACRRAEDPDYWCKTALSMVNAADDDWIVVTDWRFANESNYVIANCAKTITCRLYRSDIVEPEATIESEHQLDPYLTDLLLVRNSTEFDLAVNRFPQYRGYVPTGTV